MMELVRGIQALSHSLVHPVLTMGNFDGVHLGHQRVIQTAIQQARMRKGQAVAYTFRPHPQAFLRPSIPLQLLSTYDEKTELLERLGVDLVIEEPFNREFSSLEPEEFFKEILLRRIGVEAIVVGYDFAFGRERHGHLEGLDTFCRSASVELTVVPPQQIFQEEKSELVSSSKIRQHLLSGRLERANSLLGREFSYRGTVIRGQERGRKIGFPTANLRLENKIFLPYGVFATWAVLEGKKYRSVTHVGVRPTFQQPGSELIPLVEVHLLDASLDLYGASLEVRFVSRIREERKFSGVEELKAQISEDVSEASIRLSLQGADIISR